jgi:Ni/Co efflux regulator RcnB
MKKILLSIAAVSAVAAATVPAAAMAQSYDRGYDDRGGWNPGGDRVARLDERIDRGIRNGSLDRREAWRLKGDLRETARLQYRYGRDGLSRWERADLDRRFDRINAQIRYERHDRDYGYGYGRDRY